MKQWFKYAKPYLPYFIIGPICMIIEVIGEVVMPRLLAVVINNANAGTLTNRISLLAMAAMVGTAIVMLLGGVGGAWFGSKASVNFAADLRADLYAKIQKFAFSNIDKFSTGSLVTRLTNDVTQIQNFVNMLLRMALRAPGMLIAALIMACTIRPSMMTIFAVIIPVMAVVILFIIRTGAPRFTAMQDRVDELNSDVQESMTNVRVVKSFVREDHEMGKFAAVSKRLKDTSISAVYVMIILEPAMTLFMNIAIIAVILVGGPIVIRGDMSVGDLSSFITYVSQILISLVMVSFLLMMSTRALASGKRIKEVLNETVDLNDDNAAHPGLDVTEGSIEFRDVSFRYYKDSTDPVLEHINLTIPAGLTVGIIGSTGCGKTTLVSLIPRLYDCDSGAVLVDGVNVKDYNLTKLRDGVGMVLQNNTLFSGSIEENLLWGDKNATPEQIRTAAGYAQADRFVTAFPDGYDSLIEQGGKNVSGGQRQRLCIARALLKKPRILILDDSTSAVDTATEAEIRRAFREELKDSTKLIIAQRIGSVMDADMIIVMNEGHITGVGTHDELLKTNTEYREIYESQTGKEA